MKDIYNWHKSASSEEAKRRGCRFCVMHESGEIFSFHKTLETAYNAANRMGAGFWQVYDFQDEKIYKCTQMN